jgi:hypothetical protein
VRFRWRDYAHGNRMKLLTLEADEFIRRFILHVLPRGLMRIRHYGPAANRSKAPKLAAARAALNVPQPSIRLAPETLIAFCQRIVGTDLSRCRLCHLGTLRLVAVTRRARGARGPPVSPLCTTTSTSFLNCAFGARARNLCAAWANHPDHHTS